MTDSGCLIEGKWDNNRMVGKFFMIRPNGTCYVGEDTNGKLCGCIYPFARISEALAECTRDNQRLYITRAREISDLAKMDLCDDRFLLKFEKCYATGRVYFSHSMDRELTRPWE